MHVLQTFGVYVHNDATHQTERVSARHYVAGSPRAAHARLGAYVQLEDRVQREGAAPMVGAMAGDTYRGGGGAGMQVVQRSTQARPGGHAQRCSAGLVTYFSNKLRISVGTAVGPDLRFTSTSPCFVGQNLWPTKDVHTRSENEVS